MSLPSRIFIPTALHEQIVHLAHENPSVAVLLEKDYAGAIQLEVDPRHLPDCAALISRPTVGDVTLPMLTGTKRPFFIATLSKGIDHIDPALICDPGIQIFSATSTAGNAQAVAELTVWLAIGLLRHAYVASNRTARGVFNAAEFISARSLSGATWVTVGSGQQVQALAPLLYSHGAARLVILNRTMDERRFTSVLSGLTSVFGTRCDHSRGHLVAGFPRSPHEFVVHGTTDESFAFALADVLSLHLPGKPETAGYLGSARLAQLKPSCIVVNPARGSLVDENALLEALDQRVLSGYSADVVDPAAERTGDPSRSILWSAFIKQRESATPVGTRLNLLLTPHIGGTTADALSSVAQAVIPQLLTALNVPA